MGRRQNILRIPSPLQGAEGWIEIKAITSEQYRQRQQFVLDCRKAIAEANQAAVDQAEAGLDHLNASLIVGWNWVDDNDDPLPLPKDDPSVFDKLTMREQIFIADVINQSAAAEKKDVSISVPLSTDTST